MKSKVHYLKNQCRVPQKSSQKYYNTKHFRIQWIYHKNILTNLLCRKKGQNIMRKFPYYPHSPELNDRYPRENESFTEYIYRMHKRMSEMAEQRQQEIREEERKRAAEKAEKERKKQEKQDKERLDKEIKKAIDNDVIKELNKALGIK